MAAAQRGRWDRWLVGWRPCCFTERRLAIATDQAARLAAGRRQNRIDTTAAAMLVDHPGQIPQRAGYTSQSFANDSLYLHGE